MELDFEIWTQRFPEHSTCRNLLGDKNTSQKQGCTCNAARSAASGLPWTKEKGRERPRARPRFFPNGLWPRESPSRQVPTFRRLTDGRKKAEGRARARVSPARPSPRDHFFREAGEEKPKSLLRFKSAFPPRSAPLPDLEEEEETVVVSGEVRSG